MMRSEAENPECYCYLSWMKFLMCKRLSSLQYNDHAESRLSHRCAQLFRGHETFVLGALIPEFPSPEAGPGSV
ncbi:hypothetical protein TcWFU_004580 [Taenia crassiceps]|uniref:Uncharacterized protein n=1 Tax=Taenia crassiceps TaxID=6207 RepID=A0ABR4Q908_9CEST